MRRTLLKGGLMVAAIASAVGVAAPAASAAQVTWVTMGTYWGTYAESSCKAQGEADVANPNTPAIDFVCNPTERQIKSGVWQEGYTLVEEYLRGGG